MTDDERVAAAVAEEREACARAICPWCRAGIELLDGCEKSVTHVDHEGLHHALTGPRGHAAARCRAQAIRQRGAAPLDAVRPRTEGGER